MSPASRWNRSHRRKSVLAAAIALIALGALTSLAFGRDPLRALVGIAGKANARSGMRIGIGEATVVSPGHGPGSHSPTATEPAGSADNGETETTAQTGVGAKRTPPAGGDITAPETTITSGPEAITLATSASFAFSSNESGVTFACKVDSGKWGRCKAPKAYSSLPVAAHQFAVRATDRAGNVDATPATWSWTIAAPPPAEETPPPAEETPPPVEEIPPPIEEPPAEPTPPSEEACTTTVSSVSAAQSSVAAAAAGAVVCLADGSYGKVSLEASKAAPGVTLRAAHAGKATIAGASLQGSNLTLARFVSTSSVTIQPGASGMTVEHNRITGGGQGIDGCPSSTTTCNDTRIIGNQLIGPFEEDAIHLNRYHDANGDGVGILIEGNEITNVRENGNHSDCLQTVWVGDHIVFRRNYLHDNRCQGFFVKDQASLGGVSGPIAGITVEDNLFLRNQEPCGPPLTSCGQPMYFQVFGPYSGFKMKRNTIWGDDYDSIAAFREGTGSDTQISNNVIYRLWTDTDMSGISLTENTLCLREGSWPSSRPGETIACSLPFANPAADDYRLTGSNRGVDWAPAEVHYGP